VLWVTVTRTSIGSMFALLGNVRSVSVSECVCVCVYVCVCRRHPRKSKVHCTYSVFQFLATGW